MRRLRHVIIGVGAGVLGMHRPALRLETVDLVGVSDVDAEAGRRRATELACPFYADHRAMLAETRPEVAVIMAPHPFHAPLALDCLEAGCHVLVEKPMAVHVGEADAMIEAAARAGRLLAVNFQARHRPEVRAAHALLRRGELGAVQRVELVATWTRPAAYYRTAAWRGTWTGEGGGILMNQAPHHLDLLCHLVGLPSRVVGWTRTLFHRIETEDTAQAMLEWPDGAWGTVHVSTAEAGQPERLEIVGTRGRLELGRGHLRLDEFETDLYDFLTHTPEPFAAPAMRPRPLELEPGDGDHAAVYRNFHAAILEGAPLVCDGIEGRMALELANAIIYAGQVRETVELPLDRAKYAAMLAELRKR